MNLKENLIQLSQHNLHPVGDTGIFVKSFTVDEFNQFINTPEVDDELKTQRNFAREAFDEQGNLLFNPDDMADLQIIKNLPYALILSVLDKSRQVNGSDFFIQQINQMNAHSTTETNSSLN